MKLKKFKEKYSKKVNKKPVKNRKLVDYKWIITVTLLAFFISLIFSLFSEGVIPNANSVVAITIILLFIGIGIMFDMVGIAITVADIKTFNSMASKQVKGAKLAIKLIKNSEKASSFCNDVIGDICGIISGSAGVALANIIATNFNFNPLIVSLLITAIIAALTIGGKAMGKATAINKSTLILFRFSQVIANFYRK
ncbi:MAG: hypothetical protein MRZ42_01885 [Tenericutes bacterium]|nr:hypothetical protein [Mycoplasmatota bacterium]